MSEIVFFPIYQDYPNLSDVAVECARVCGQLTATCDNPDMASQLWQVAQRLNNAFRRDAEMTFCDD